MTTLRRTPLDVCSLGTILSVWAHPDDETYLAGGMMAAAAACGQRVVCVSASAGEHGTSDPVEWPPDRLGRIRRLEATAAMAVLGVREHEILGFPDGQLAAHDEHGAAAVDRLLDAVKPDTILTFGADGMTFHEDHIAVHRWVTDAWDRRGRRGRLLYATSPAERLRHHRATLEEWGVYMDDRRPVGPPGQLTAVELHLAGTALDRKLTALRALATQTAPSVAAIGEVAYAELAAHEAFIDADVVIAIAARAAGVTDARSNEEGDLAGPYRSGH